MFLRPKVSRTKTLDVGFVKRLELQGLAPQVAEVAVSLALRADEIASVFMRCNETALQRTIH